MRSPIYRRRARTNNLRISVRDDVPKIPGDPDVSDSGDEGGPDSPSPISPNFPPPPQAEGPRPTQQPTVTSTEQISSTTSPGPTQQPTVSSSEQASLTTSPRPTQQLTVTSSEQILSTISPASSRSSRQTTSSVSTSVSITPASSFSASITQDAESQNTDVTQAQVSRPQDSAPSMGRGGTIAFGTIGAVIIVVALGAFVWRCRRSRIREKRGLFTGSTTSSGFQRMEEPRRPITAVTAEYRSSRGTLPRDTPSRMMDNLMTAAYAAEDGNASQYGAYVDRRQSNRSAYTSDPRQPMSMRESSAPIAQPPSGSGTNSIYVNQLNSGFYQGQRADGLTAPPNARMPPPPAPSVTGQTEVTATSESTWRTWGWSQPKQQTKEGWIDKCVRLGGLR